MKAKAVLSVLMASLMAWFPAITVTGNLPLGKVIYRGSAELNGTQLQIESTVYSGDTLTTADEGLALLFLSKGDQLHVGPATEVQVAQAEGAVVASVARGAVLALSGLGQTISVRTRGLAVNPQAPTRYEVVVKENTVVVAARQAAVTVQDAKQTYTVEAGKAMQFELADNVNALDDGVSVGLIIAVAVVAAGGGILAGWLIGTNRAQDRCLERVRALSPAVPQTVCDF